MVGPKMVVLFEEVEIVLEEKPLHKDSLSQGGWETTVSLIYCRGRKLTPVSITP